MISPEVLYRIAPWSRELDESARARACRGISEKVFSKGATVCHRGDRFDSWAGVCEGIVSLETVSRAGKAVCLAGVRDGGWFGEGSMLKGEPRRYDIVPLRDTRLALMDRATFFWMFEHSAGFNRYLVRQFNERLAQFMAQVEYDRMLDAPARVARTIAWLFNPTLYPECGKHLAITQEDVGLLSGVSRQSANQSLRLLEDERLISADRNGITIIDLAKLQRFGD